MSRLFLWLGLFCFAHKWAPGHSLCGRPTPTSALLDGAEGRIIMGDDATYGQYPWALAIEVNDDGDWSLHCGATLIDANWALTAASCIDQHLVYRIVAGDYNRISYDVSEQFIPLARSQFHPHPDFNDTGIGFNNTIIPYANDIALIDLTGDPANVASPYINPICLPRSPDFIYAENPLSFISGWGSMNGPGGPSADILQEHMIDVIRHPYCQERWLPLQLLDESLCVFDQVIREITACTGDMGSGLNCMVNLQYEMAGVASYMDPTCDPAKPVLYTNVPPYLDWIKSITGL